jgi:hypothetical protein
MSENIFIYSGFGLDTLQFDLSPKRLVPQGGSQKSKVKSQKCYGIRLLKILNGCSISAVLY